MISIYGPEVPVDYDLPFYPESDTGYLLSQGIEATFNVRNAKDWIGRFCVYKVTGDVDIFATANILKIPVKIVPNNVLHFRMGRTVGLIESERQYKTTILLAEHQDSSYASQELTFGHELGHIFIEQHEDGYHDRYYAQKLTRNHYDESLEDFCDYFATHVVG